MILFDGTFGHMSRWDNTLRGDRQGCCGRLNRRMGGLGSRTPGLWEIHVEKAWEGGVGRGGALRKEEWRRG